MIQLGTRSLDALAIGMSLGIATMFFPPAAVLLPVAVGWLVRDTQGQMADRVPALSLLLVGFVVPLGLAWSNGR